MYMSDIFMLQFKLSCTGCPLKCVYMFDFALPIFSYYSSSIYVMFKPTLYSMSSWNGCPIDTEAIPKDTGTES